MAVLGKPDMVVTVPDAPIPATGVMDYQHPVVANAMTEGRWMKATTFRISDRQVVHHILTGVLNPATLSPACSFSEAQWGASLGGYGPGRGSNIEPFDTGVWIPASGAHRLPDPLYALWPRRTTEEDPDGPLLLQEGRGAQVRPAHHGHLQLRHRHPGARGTSPRERLYRLPA